MRLTITHKTLYDYDAPVPYALQQVRLTPKSRSGQTVLHWSISVEGGKVELDFDDQHNNRVNLVSTDPGRQQIAIHCEGDIETTNGTGVIGTHGGFAPLWYFMRTTPLTKPGPSIRKLVKTLEREQDISVSALHELSTLILDTVAYETGMTHAGTLAEEALEAGHGVCQDHAHIFVAAARLLGFPARYVSGYLLMDSQTQQDASHGWAEAHVQGLGWVGFDISNGISPDERYIRVATGLDYSEAAPVSGVRFGGSGEIMSVSLEVQQ